MLYYDQINVSEDKDINKTNYSCEFKTCYCSYLSDINFSFRPCPCTGYHDLLQKVISFEKVATVSVKNK